MKTKTLTIGLFHDRIDVLLCNGAQAVDGRRIDFAIEQDGVKWRRAAQDAAGAIRVAAEDMGAAGAMARIMYRGPTACAEYVTPRVSSLGDAAGAATLACSDALDCPLEVAATRSMVIAFEPREKPPRAQVVVAADGDDAVTALQQMTLDAGLRFEGAAPIDAVIMAEVAERVMRVEEGLAATLYVGEYRSFLAIASDGAMLFARPISIGLDALITSLTRPLGVGGGQSVELSRDVARSIVNEHGFPSRSEAVHEALGLTGVHVLPVLQPVLQRLMLEVRQSMRFALPQEKRNELTLTLQGPGARTPGLRQIIADELGLAVELDERYQAVNHLEPASAGSEIADALTSRKALRELTLEPVAIARKRRMRQMQRWLWTGAAAAFALIAFDGVRYHGRLAQLREQHDTIIGQSEGRQALRASTDRLRAMTAAMKKLESIIDHETGGHVRMGAVMQEFSRITPESIRLSSIWFKPGSDTMMGGVSGFALSASPVAAPDSALLQTYMKRLSESPLLSRLALANVQTAVLNEAPAQTFDVGFHAIKTPTELFDDTAIVEADPDAEVGP